jgi:hypothetical protein
MELSPEWLAVLCDGPVLAEVAELDLRDNPLGLDLDFGAVILAGNLRAPALRDLNLVRTGLGERGLIALAESPNLTGLCRLDLSLNPVGTADGSRALAGSKTFAQLRSLRLAECGFGDQAVKRLTRAEVWRNLVELDVRGNYMTLASIGYLLKAAVPPELTAIFLSGERIGPDPRPALHQHYGERMIFHEE